MGVVYKTNKLIEFYDFVLPDGSIVHGAGTDFGIPNRTGFVYVRSEKLSGVLCIHKTDLIPLHEIENERLIWEFLNEDS